MRSIDLFYDLRTLNEIPEESKKIFFDLNSRILPRRDINNGITKILLLFPTNEILNRSYKKMLINTNMQRLEERSLLSVNENRIYEFFSVDDLLHHKLVGKIYNQIRFIEGK